MNHILHWILFGFLLLSANQNPLEGYRWKNRIIIISAPTENMALRNQIFSLNEAKDEMQDRDLKILQLINGSGHLDNLDSLDEASVQIIRKKHGIKEDEFELLLIGKDGTVKLRRNAYVSPQILFDLIDSMPMRRSEMKKG